MQFRRGPIQGVVIRDLIRFSDPRGWLSELFRVDELEQQSLPAMSYVSATLPGSARGPHEHRHQSDLFCLVGPSNFRFTFWDNREGSPTFLNTMSAEAGEDNPRSIIIPAGVVHGYRNIGPQPGWVINFPNKLYRGEGHRDAVDEIRHEDNPDSPFVLD